MTSSVSATELNGAAIKLPLDTAADELWSESTPRKLRKIYPSRDAEQGWQAWTEHLAKRRRPAPLADLLPGRASPLSWALPDKLRVSRTARLIDQLWKLERGAAKPNEGAVPIADELNAWLAEAETGTVDTGTGATAYALEALAWCRVLPRLAPLVTDSLWWQLWQHLSAAATELRPVDSRHDGAPAESTPEQIVIGQMRSCELPLCLAHQFPELAASEELAAAGRRAVEKSLLELLPGAGLPPARLWSVFRPLLACWTRALTVARDPEARRKGSAAFALPPQFADFVVTAWRLCRADGSQMLVSDASGAWNRHLFAAADRLVTDADADVEIAAICQLAAPDAKSGGKHAARKRAARFRAPSPAVHTEASESAVMRSGWERSDVRLACSYADHQVWLELGVGRDTLISGVWELTARIDGRAAQLESGWDEVSWHSDDDIDYLEIEAQLTGGLRVQRQILLARDDRFLFLADAMLYGAAASLEYSGVLPLEDSVGWDPAAETCESFLTVGKSQAGSLPRALVLPLALPEWRSASRCGNLAQTASGMELREKAHGRSLLAPLFIDLDRGRLRKPFTWRQLTVAESLKAQPSDVAVGYRVEIAKQQWLFYRSLISGGVRSVLGQQLAREFMVARFKRSGDAERLLEIEMA
jgi:hypothetical protein